MSGLVLLLFRGGRLNRRLKFSGENRRRFFLSICFRARQDVTVAGQRRPLRLLFYPFCPIRVSFAAKKEPCHSERSEESALVFCFTVCFVLISALFAPFAYFAVSDSAVAFGFQFWQFW